MLLTVLVFVFKQKTAYEMRISDWSSDVCSADLAVTRPVAFGELPLPDRESRLMRYAPGLCAAFFIALCAASTAAATELLITDARVYPAPGVAPIENGAVLVRDDRIVAVGPSSPIVSGLDPFFIVADARPDFGSS